MGCNRVLDKKCRIRLDFIGVELFARKFRMVANYFVHIYRKKKEYEGILCENLQL